MQHLFFTFMCLEEIIRCYSIPRGIFLHLFHKAAICLFNKSNIYKSHTWLAHVARHHIGWVVQQQDDQLLHQWSSRHVYSLCVLVDVHRAVESFQLSHQQLKVGINVAQLQEHHVFNLVVGCGPARRRERSQLLKNADRWTIEITVTLHNIVETL